MLKKLLALGAVLVPLALVPVTSASAATTTLGCNIQPNNNDNFTPVCFTRDAASSYTVDFFVQAAPAGATYVWTHPTPAGSAVVSGTCTSTNPDCELTGVRGEQVDQTLTTTVTVTVNGTTTTYSSVAHLNAVCGRVFC